MLIVKAVLKVLTEMMFSQVQPLL